jgi:hypothetical protein
MRGSVRRTLASMINRRAFFGLLVAAAGLGARSVAPQRDYRQRAIDGPQFSFVAEYDQQLRQADALIADLVNASGR